VLEAAPGPCSGDRASDFSDRNRGKSDVGGGPLGAAALSLR
jgi:hypothetical protein